MTSASRNIVPFPRAEVRRREQEIAFLPAALEITESPPSPIGRAIGASIIAVFCVALVWASFGSVDIVATATGKIVPGGRTKLIQPFETGVVRAIHVRDGQSVKAGDVLIELDPTMNAAELGHLKSDLIAAELDVARLRAALAGEVRLPWVNSATSGKLLAKRCSAAACWALRGWSWCMMACAAPMRAKGARAA